MSIPVEVRNSEWTQDGSKGGKGKKLGLFDSHSTLGSLESHQTPQWCTCCCVVGGLRQAPGRSHRSSFPPPQILTTGSLADRKLSLGIPNYSVVKIRYF